MHKKIWFICPNGHSYPSYIYSRTCSRKTGCPYCTKEYSTSFAEQAVFYYIRQVFPDVINPGKDIIDAFDLDFII